MRRALKVTVAVAMTIPCAMLDLGTVFRESYPGEAIHKLTLPEVWGWALAKEDK